MSSSYLCGDVGGGVQQGARWLVRAASFATGRAYARGKETHYKTQRDGTYESSSSMRAFRAAAVVLAVAAESVFVLVLLWV